MTPVSLACSPRSVGFGAAAACKACAGCRGRLSRWGVAGAAQGAQGRRRPLLAKYRVVSRFPPAFSPDPTRSAMSHHDMRSAKRPDPDQPMVDIANYVADYKIQSNEA